LVIFEVFEDALELKKRIKSAGFLFMSFSDKAVLLFLWNLTLSNFFYDAKLQLTHLFAATVNKIHSGPREAA
jgi:hypothetical protein